MSCTPPHAQPAAGSLSARRSGEDGESGQNVKTMKRLEPVSAVCGSVTIIARLSPALCAKPKFGELTLSHRSA